MEKLRLDKFLSSQLNISRADAKKLISGGRVALDPPRKVTADLQVDPASDLVFADGRAVEYRKYLYLMLNKPAGVVSATEDAGVTVIDLVPESLRRAGLFPAGRLDKDTTGFVLITDDGAFAHRILSPAHHVEKAYFVTLTRAVTQAEQRLIASGMPLDGERLKPARLTPAPAADAPYRYEIVLTQGIYHQIKRMFASVGNPVIALHRFRMGGVTLDPTLAPGECRLMSADEVKLTEM